MDGLASTPAMTDQRIEQDRQISEIIGEQRSRLRNFIRGRVADPADVEDILQDVFYKDPELRIENLLPSPDTGPEGLYIRNALLDELELALAEMPAEQREVFIAHELDGRSFKELAAESGVNINTLLARKRYAVLHLRARLQSIYEEFY